MDDLDDRSDQAIRARLKAAADEVEECEEASKLARERRDGIVVEAVELGHHSRHVARWVRLSQGRVMGILADH